MQTTFSQPKKHPDFPEPLDPKHYLDEMQVKELSIPTGNDMNTSKTQTTIDQFQQYVIGNYRRYPVVLSHGEGSWIWDVEGKKYLDFFPGWGCGILGHCPPRVVQAVQTQVAKLIHVPNTWYIEPQGELAQALCTRVTFPAKAFFCNSGAEANEAAIKLARLHGRGKGPNGGNRYKVVTMHNSFHGRTFGALSATAQPKYHAGMEPMLPGFLYCPHGDLDAVKKVIDSETAAILIEPIQGEGGINLPPTGYLEGLRDICNQNHMLLMFDEVQTGMGRTGKWYAHQHWNIEPDVVTLAKALAGGIAMGGLIARPEIADHLVPGTHAATFGGNPVACAAALATMETIEQEQLLDRAIQIGSLFRERFEALQQKCPLVHAIRIRGTMIGLELSTDGTPVVAECMKRGLLINCTHQTVIRLLPSLLMTDAELHQGCDILSEVLLSYHR